MTEIVQTDKNRYYIKWPKGHQSNTEQKHSKKQEREALVLSNSNDFSSAFDGKKDETKTRHHPKKGVKKKRTKTKNCIDIMDIDIMYIHLPSYIYVKGSSSISLFKYY